MTASAHVPVLLDAVIAAAGPIRGDWIDGTFGAGGYARALHAAGADRVIGIDRDPQAHAMAAPWLAEAGGAIRLVPGRFGDLDRIAQAEGVAGAAGVVLDIGVSSMQIDVAERGFSFLRDGPLDMRMEQSGPSAADLVNGLSETALADLFHLYGEERAARRIARRIVERRGAEPLDGTLSLSRLIEGCLPRARPGQPHPATRCFQALRIAVNDELGELVRGLAAAERILAPGGMLAVVTFHSLEDRIVKRFIQTRSGEGPGNSRHAPEQRAEVARFEKVTRKAVAAGPAEAAENPRARSAKLRVARRLDAPAGPVDAESLGLPRLDLPGSGLAHPSLMPEHN